MKYALRILTFVCFSFPLALFADTSVVGNWQLSFPTDDGGTMTVKVSMKNDGTYTVDFGVDGTIEVNGKYKVEGDKMTIKDVSGPQSCSGTGVYTVTVEGDTLTMKQISDECEGRSGPEGVLVFSRA